MKMKGYDEIHFWQLPLELMWFKLESKVRRDLLIKARQHFGSWAGTARFLNGKSRKYGLTRKYTGRSISRLFHEHKGSRKYIPGWVIFESAKVIGYDLELIEKNIESCEYFGGHYKIKLKIPILVTPELVSLVANLMGDGFVPLECAPSVTSYYKQYDAEALNKFKQKLRNVFGEYLDACNSEIAVNIPRIYVRIIARYFDIHSFYWHDTRVPEKIKKMPKNFKIAFLSAFIVDEGTVGQSRIAIFSGNKKLLEDIRKIASSLEYECSSILKQHATEYYFLIYMASAGKLLQDVKEVAKDFPTCDLCHKQRKLESMVQIQTREWKQRKIGEPKKLILQALARSPKTASELSNEMFLSESTVRWHLRRLLKENLIRMISKHGRNSVWGLVENGQVAAA